jgi:hypothetical protein
MAQIVSPSRRQVVDLRAAVIAGLVSGILFLVVASLVTTNALGTPVSVIRLFASVVLGEGILNPGMAVSPIAWVAALAVHLIYSLLFGLLVAYVVHRWGFIVGIIGGGLLGLALYFINFYSFSLLFPWLFAFRGTLLMLGHVLFGAVTGGLYELLENERYEEAA